MREAGLFLRIGVGHTILALGTVYHAYNLKRQFFPTCIYLMKSSLSMVVLVSYGIFLMTLVANMIKNVLFGALRPIELDHLHEYGWMTVSESFLAMTIFRNEFDSKFALVFAGLILCKGFHWILRDRVEYMEQAIRLPEQFHVKILAALYMLALTDFVAMILSVEEVAESGPSMFILVANEFALMLVTLASVITRYALNLNDIRRGSPWESRSSLLFYLDFAFDLSKLIIYLFYFAVIVHYYGLPIHIIRDLYMTFRSFVIRVNDIIRYRQATADMDRKYPTVTATELAASPDKVCIICREEMEIGEDGPKKLPCGHFFHLRCLRSWLERQQACPTCRKSVIAKPEDHVAGQYPGNIRVNDRPVQEHRDDPTVRLSENNPVMYVSRENLVPVENEEGRYILRDPSAAAGTPVYLERVNVLSHPSSVSLLSTSTEAQSSSASTESLKRTRDMSLESLQGQISALETLHDQIGGILERAKDLKDAIDKERDKENI